MSKPATETPPGHRDGRAARLIAFGAVLLSLTSFALAAPLPENTVFSEDIVDGQVKTADLAPAAITGAQIAPDSVRTDQLAPNHLFGQDIDDDAVDGRVLAPGAIANKSLAETLRVDTAFSASRHSTDELGSEKTVISLNLPPGAYVLSGDITLRNTSDDTRLAGCWIFVNGVRKTGDQYFMTEEGGNGANFKIRHPILDLAESSNAISAEVRCDADEDVTAGDGVLAALPVRGIRE